MQEQTLITVEVIVKGIYEIASKDTSRDSDKLKAFELLGKHLGMFSDKPLTGFLPPLTDKDETEHNW